MTDIEKTVTMLDNAGLEFSMGPDPEGHMGEEYIDLPGGTRLYFDANGNLVDAV